jgi:hypothetical protein
MKVEIISAVMISGEPFSEGSILDLSKSDAVLLINSNKAMPAVEPEVQPEPLKRNRKSTSIPEVES